MVFEDKGTWFIAEFAEDGSADIVPDFWLRNEGKDVAWPPFPNATKLMRTVRTRGIPDVSWKLQPLNKVYWDTGKRLITFVYFQT